MVWGMKPKGRESLRVEISVATLRRLLEGGHLGASDLRCLDGASKQCVWRMCLSCCAASLRGNGRCEGCPLALCPGRKGSSRKGTVFSGPGKADA